MKPLIIEHSEEYEDDEECREEFDDMGSYNHSFLQAKLAALFFGIIFFYRFYIILYNNI